MDQDRPFLKRTGEFALNVALQTVLGAAFLIPYRRRIPAIGWFTSRVVAPLAGYDKRIRDNLRRTHPDMPEDEVQNLVRRVPNNMGRALIETYSGAPFVKIASNAAFTGPGLDVLEQAKKDGRPVIIVTGHIGNYDAARAALISKGHRIGGFFRPLDNPYVNKHYVRAITRIGTPLFEQGRKGMTAMVRHLKTGGVVAIVADRHAVGGTVMPFFGQPAATSLVTAELALRFNAPLLPVYGMRNPDGLTFTIVTEEPVPHTDAETMTRDVTARLEAMVRDHMDQWLWIHRRWKV